MNVGKRIRKMREAQDVSLEKLAETAGVDAAKLREIEEGVTVPSIGMVVKLSRALGAHMGRLIHEGGARSELFSIVTAGDGAETERRSAVVAPTGQGYRYQSLLAPEVCGQGMEPFIVEFDPAAASTVQAMSHQGEEFIHVLSGTLELDYDGETHTLKKGDSLYLDSSKPHALRGLGSTPPKAIAVILSRD